MLQKMMRWYASDMQCIAEDVFLMWEGITIQNQEQFLFYAI